MTSHRLKHMELRGEQYHLRLAIPTDLQSRFGRKELRWSLRTKDRKHARRKTLFATLEFEALCDKVRKMTDLTVDQIKNLAQGLYEQLMAGHKLLGPKALGDWDDTMHLQELGAEEFRLDIQAQIDSRSYNKSTENFAKQALETINLDYDSLNPNQELQLLEVMARAQLEYVQYSLFRMDSTVDAYEPHDPLFVGQPKPESHSKFRLIETLGPKAKGLTITDAIERYISYKTKGEDTGESAWKSKDVPAFRRALDWFAILAGPHEDVTNLNKEHVHDYSNLIIGLKLHTPEGVNITQYQAKAGEKHIGAKTAKNYFAKVVAFLRWLNGNLHIDKDIVANINLGLKAKSSNRRSFSKNELNQLFSSPMYVGCQSEKQRTSSGDKIIRDGFYWLPLLALYTGLVWGSFFNSNPQIFPSNKTWLISI